MGHSCSCYWISVANVRYRIWCRSGKKLPLINYFYCTVQTFRTKLTLCFTNSLYNQLVNRQKKSKKKAPLPLTADMLNELNKNHMGGLENYEQQDEFYNHEDTWNDNKYAVKSKV